jgi:hypothetical protein
MIQNNNIKRIRWFDSEFSHQVLCNIYENPRRARFFLVVKRAGDSEVSTRFVAMMVPRGPLRDRNGDIVFQDLNTLPFTQDVNAIGVLMTSDDGVALLLGNCSTDVFSGQSAQVDYTFPKSSLTIGMKKASTFPYPRVSDEPDTGLTEQDGS